MVWTILSELYSIGIPSTKRELSLSLDMHGLQDIQSIPTKEMMRACSQLRYVWRQLYDLENPVAQQELSDHCDIESGPAWDESRVPLGEYGRSPIRE